ncbi:MAG TPA: hypothetical protein VGB41_01410 [Acidimicrobiia bacterium]
MRRIHVDARFAIAGLLAVVAAVLVMVLTRPVARIPVLIAGDALPAGVPLADLPVAEALIEPIDGLVAADRASELADRTLAVPLDAGSPILLSLLVPASGSTADVLAVTLEQANAVQGDLRPGDLVDVYVSDDEGTRRIAERVGVVDATVGGGGLGGNEVAVLLAVDQALAEQVIAAMHTGAVDLVRRGR